MRAVGGGERSGAPRGGDGHPRAQGVGSLREHPIATVPRRRNVVDFHLEGSMDVARLVDVVRIGRTSAMVVGRGSG